MAHPVNGTRVLGVWTCSGHSLPASGAEVPGLSHQEGGGPHILTLVHLLKRSMPEGGILGTWNLPSNQHLQCWLIQVVAEDRLRKLG